MNIVPNNLIVGETAKINSAFVLIEFIVLYYAICTLSTGIMIKPRVIEAENTVADMWRPMYDENCISRVFKNSIFKYCVGACRWPITLRCRDSSPIRGLRVCR